MNLSQFRAWSHSASVHQRCDVARQLARRTLIFQRGTQRRSAHEAALMILLDDPERSVRSEIAGVLAESDHTPLHAVQLLLDDRDPAISHLMYRHSPVIYEQELLEAAERHHEPLSLVLAARLRVSAALCHALLEFKSRAVCIALLNNSGAELAADHLHRMATQFGSDTAIRELLLNNPALPITDLQELFRIDVRHELMAREAPTRSRLPQAETIRESVEDVTVALAFGAERTELAELARYLCDTSQVTPSLLIRAVLSGNMPFVCDILANLTEMRSTRIESLIAARRWGSVRTALRRVDIHPSTICALEFLLDEASRAMEEASDLLDDACESNDSFFTQTEQHALVSATLDRLANMPPELQTIIPLLNRMRTAMRCASFTVLQQHSDAA